MGLANFIALGGGVLGKMPGWLECEGEGGSPGTQETGYLSTGTEVFLYFRNWYDFASRSGLRQVRKMHGPGCHPCAREGWELENPAPRQGSSLVIITSKHKKYSLFVAAYYHFMTIRFLFCSPKETGAPLLT